MILVTEKDTEMQIGSKEALDEQAWEREFERVESNQKQRKDDGLSNLVPHIRMPKLRPYVQEQSEGLELKKDSKDDE